MSMNQEYEPQSWGELEHGTFVTPRELYAMDARGANFKHGFAGGARLEDF